MRAGCIEKSDELQPRIQERKGFSTEYCIMGQRVASSESFSAVVRRTLLNFTSLPGL